MTTWSIEQDGHWIFGQKHGHSRLWRQLSVCEKSFRQFHKNWCTLISTIVTAVAQKLNILKIMSACWNDFYFMVEKISNGFFESKRRSTINSFSSLLGRSIILVSLKGKRSSLLKSSSWNTLRSAGKNNWKNPANQEAAGRLSALKRLLIGPKGFVKQTNRIFCHQAPLCAVMGKLLSAF